MSLNEKEVRGVDLGIAPAPDLLHGEEHKVWGDARYRGQTEPRLETPKTSPEH
jgi:hypothetical protein